MSLTGTAPSGATYRLRDATLTVDGPTPTVFHTEDDPTRTSLSADAAPGDYTATLQDGWRIERLDDSGPTDVMATLESANPLAFTVAPEMRTTVPLQFQIDGGVVDLGSGYDIVLGIDESIPSPGPGYQVIDAPSPRTRLVFDAARQTLYALDAFDQEIERYAQVGGTWSTLTPVVVPALTDIAITPDDTTMIVLDQDHVNDVVLGGDGFVLNQRATLSNTFCGEFLAHAATGSNNKVFIAGDFLECEGFSGSFVYDTQSHALTASGSFFEATVGASGDGSRIYIGSDGIDPPNALTVFTPASGTFASTSLSLNLSAIGVSDDASHVLLQNAAVYSQSLTLLGNITSGGSAVVSHNGTRAYVYFDDAPGPRILTFDLTGALGAGAVFPLIHTVRLPNTPNSSNGSSVALLATSSDDTQLFVSGDRRLLVVPVN